MNEKVQMSHGENTDLAPKEVGSHEENKTRETNNVVQ